MRLNLPRALALSLFVTVATGSVRAQCPTWDAGFHLPGAFDDVRAMAVFDDGGGQKLYVGGELHLVGMVGVSGLARLNGTVWEPVGDLTWGVFPGEVNALTVFDDGHGPALYVGGKFDMAGGASANNIVRFDGTTWKRLHQGTQGSVHSLTVFDDGGGPGLFVGGSFQSADGLFVNSIARWRAGAWSNLGLGLYDGAGNAAFVSALEIFDSGSGPELYAGGNFNYAGATEADGIARWNGTNWSSVGSGLLGPIVGALKTFDDGSGSALFVTGAFVTAGGVNAHAIARWNGTDWSTLGGGLSGPGGAQGSALEVFDDGSGPALYVGGLFQTANGVSTSNIARWTGTTFTALASGINAKVKCLRSFDDGGGGRKLFAGGAFSSPSSQGYLTGIGRWNGSSWLAVSDGNGVAYSAPASTGGNIAAFEVFDAGSGPELYAGGLFGGVGTQSATSIARWTSAGWSALSGALAGNVGNPSVSVADMKTFDAGTGANLYVAGSFVTAGGIGVLGFARWDGSAWSDVPGAQYSTTALAVFDDGSGAALYAAADYSVSNMLSRFDGSTWSTVLGPSGVTWHFNALASFDDGSGPALYATGFVYTIAGTSVNHIARWNGSTWSALGTGLGSAPGRTLAVHDDGTGPALYVGGAFTQAGGVPVDHIARWNGSTWSAVGSQPFGAATIEVDRLSSIDLGLGTGPVLLAGGTRAGVAPATIEAAFAAWDGSNWFQLDGGVGGAASVGSGQRVQAFSLYNDGSSNGPSLFVGGHFATAGTTASANIARLRLCGTPGSSLCAGDGSGAACPCANSGLPGHGCDNSVSTGGALLVTSGGALLAQDNLALHASSELPSALSIFLQGNAQIAPAAFGDGLRCTGGNLKRLYVKNASAGSANAPAGGDLALHARSAQLGDVIPPGGVRLYQVYYRDPNLGFCAAPTGNTWNVTNAMRIEWR